MLKKVSNEWLIQTAAWSFCMGPVSRRELTPMSFGLPVQEWHGASSAYKSSVLDSLVFACLCRPKNIPYFYLFEGDFLSLLLARVKSNSPNLFNHIMLLSHVTKTFIHIRWSVLISNRNVYRIVVIATMLQRGRSHKIYRRRAVLYKRKPCREVQNIKPL